MSKMVATNALEFAKRIAERKSSDTQTALVDYLMANKLLDQASLEAALAEQSITGEKLSIILSRSGFVNRKRLLEAMLVATPDNVHGARYFSVRVPGDLLMSLQAMIVAETDSQLFVATTNSERFVLEELKPYFPDMAIRFVPANHEELDDYLTDLKQMAEDENNLVERLMRQALGGGVSDVHVEPRHSTYSVFFRHLGVKHLAHEGSLDEYNTLAARVKDLSRMDLAERRIPQDGAFQMDYDGKIVDLRVATVPTVNGEKIVIRLLDPDRVQPTLTGLGISNVLDWRKGVSRPDGLCLICGPTGSGKTTTLNASIKEMDRFGRAIYSVEDPVEYRIAYTSQVNTNPALGLDFARAVRAFMRADPDVIILGEVRDTETARNAVKAAETGHLVMATLHTGSIFGAVQRLSDLDVPHHELRYLLRSVLVQRLLRVYCVHCHGKGCLACMNTGYGGRTIVSECAYFSGEKDVTRLLNHEQWWPSMFEDAVSKYDQGITSATEVVRVFGAEAEDYFNQRNIAF